MKFIEAQLEEAIIELLGAEVGAPLVRMMSAEFQCLEGIRR